MYMCNKWVLLIIFYRFPFLSHFVLRTLSGSPLHIFLSSTFRQIIQLLHNKTPDICTIINCLYFYNNVKCFIMSYINRLIEVDLSEKLSASGAVLIKGPKSCGKTETAKQFAKSILEMDRDKQVPLIMATNPKLLLQGKTPRLIDEWQEQQA